MRNIAVIICFIVSSPAFTQAPYEFSLQQLSGNPVNISAFAGKKLLVVTFSSAQPDTILLKRIDSLYKSNLTSLSVLALPITDLYGSRPDSSLAQLLFGKLNLSMKISTSIKGRKTSGAQQSSFAKWLTTASENGHFDTDIVVNGQMFMLSEDGVLFAVFRSDTPTSLLVKALDRPAQQ